VQFKAMRNQYKNIVKMSANQDDIVNIVSHLDGDVQEFVTGQKKLLEFNKQIAGNIKND
jgi:hypothetical protein